MDFLYCNFFIILSIKNTKKKSIVYVEKQKVSINITVFVQSKLWLKE